MLHPLNGAKSMPMRALTLAALLSFFTVGLVTTCSCATDPVVAQRRAAIYYDLGVNQFRDQRYREAMSQFETALREFPEYAPAHAAMGLLYFSMQKYDQAIVSYKKALEYDPSLTDVYNNLGSVYLALERYDEAIPLFEKAAADLSYPTPYLAVQNLGWALYKTGRTKEGIRKIKDALLMNPRLCIAHRTLGLIHAERDDCRAALASFQDYAKICPAEQLAWSKVAEFEGRCGSESSATDAWAKCAEIDPSSEMGRTCATNGPCRDILDRAAGHEKRNDWAKVQAAYGEYVRVCPDKQEGYAKQGEAAIKAGDLTEARKALRQCESQNPKSPQGRECRALSDGLR